MLVSKEERIDFSFFFLSFFNYKIVVSKCLDVFLLLTLISVALFSQRSPEGLSEPSIPMKKSPGKTIMKTCSPPPSRNPVPGNSK
jgi:hypothetical protein